CRHKALAARPRQRTPCSPSSLSCSAPSLGGRTDTLRGICSGLRPLEWGHLFWMAPAGVASFGRDHQRLMFDVGDPIPPSRRAKKKDLATWLDRTSNNDRISLNGRLYAVPSVTPTAPTPLQA